MARGNRTEWSLQLIDQRTRKPILDDGAVMKVMVAGSPVAASLSTGLLDDFIALNGVLETDDTAGRLTSNGGLFRFWTDNTVTSVDVSVYTTDGQAVFIRGVESDEHHIDVDCSSMHQVLVMPFRAASGVTVDTGVVFKKLSVAFRCYISVTTLSSGHRLEVGTGGWAANSDGFLKLGDVSVTGFRNRLNPVTGDNETYLGSSYLGTNLGTSVNGTDTLYDTGTIIERQYPFAEGGDSWLTYGGTTGSVATGYIYVELLNIPI